jgi:hypothetical protein
MRTFILQEIITVRGGTGAGTVTQPESGWVDLSELQDIVAWLDVREASGSPTIAIQTSPTKDDSLFATMVSQAISVGMWQLKVLLSSASVPLARYVRWQITGTPTWDATFRVYVAASAG